MTYLLLNGAFLAPALLLAATAFVLARRRRPAQTRSSGRALVVALAAILLATAIFDNVIIGTGVVAYDPTRISGARIGLAPIEDFAYAIAAAVLLPSLWMLLRRPRANA